MFKKLITSIILASFFGCLKSTKVLEQKKNDKGEIVSRMMFNKKLDLYIKEDYINEQLSTRKTINKKENKTKKEAYGINGELWLESIYSDSVIKSQIIYDLKGFHISERRYFQNFNNGITVYYDSLGRTGYIKIGNQKGKELEIIYDTLNNPIKIITPNDSIIYLN